MATRRQGQVIGMHRWIRGSLGVLSAAGLLAVGLAAGPAAPAAASQAPGTWAKTGSMTTPRQGQTATLLANGQVLVISGGSAGAELYNPATGKWTATGSPAAPATGYTMTLLQNGQVLLAGGDQDGTPATATSSAELYNPANGTWSATGSMTTARAGHTATLLPNGQVLVAGGEGTCVNFSCPVLASAELYNPATGTWAQTGSMNVTRTGHTATLLRNGQVLVAGGESGSTANAGSTAELYNPATGTWAATGSMGAPHFAALAGLLPTGQVLVVRGSSLGHPICSAELYNPATGTWADDGAASPSGERDFTAVLLNNGQVLISGGLFGTYPAKVHVEADATLFDPATKTATSTGSMTIPRAFHTLTVLPNGQVLAAGETQTNKGAFSTTAGAELYTP
jgi:galactose oxidase-like protein